MVFRCTMWQTSCALAAAVENFACILLHFMFAAPHGVCATFVGRRKTIAYFRAHVETNLDEFNIIAV